MDPTTLTRLLTDNGCSLSKTAKALGVTTQRVFQMVREQGLVITKRVERDPSVTPSMKMMQRRKRRSLEK